MPNPEVVDIIASMNDMMLATHPSHGPEKRAYASHGVARQALAPDLNTQTSLSASTLCRIGHGAFSDNDMTMNMHKHVQHGFEQNGISKVA